MVDNSKLNYLSTWDIDQLVDTNTVAVNSGDTAIYTIPSSLPPLPVFEVQFQPGSSGPWYQAGGYSTNGTTANFTIFYTYVSGGKLYIHAPTAGNARYFVWSDRIDY